MPMSESLAMQVGWKLHEIHHRHMIRMHGLIEDCGLHWGQPRILHTVRVMDGAPQKEIAEKLQISPASLAMSVKRMQRAGLIEKKTDEKDLRSNRICLTRKGRGVEEMCFSFLRETDERMLDGFENEDMERLYAYLEHICRNLERLEETKHDR